MLEVENNVKLLTKDALGLAELLILFEYPDAISEIPFQLKGAEIFVFKSSNNLLQFINQVTVEFRFQKSLAQERFKSNLEFRYQIIVSSIKFRKGFAKIMIPIALFEAA